MIEHSAGLIASDPLLLLLADRAHEWELFFRMVTTIALPQLPDPADTGRVATRKHRRLLRCYETGTKEQT